MKKQMAVRPAVAPAKANVAELAMEIQIWPIDKFVLYVRNPRKNEAVVDRMCASIKRCSETLWPRGLLGLIFSDGGSERT